MLENEFGNPRKTTVDQLRLNDIACLRLTTHRALSFDPYHENRGTGAFILIDFMSNNTVGAGMIQDTFDAEVSQVLLTTESQISMTERAQRLRQKPYVLSLHGQRSTEIAYALEKSYLTWDIFLSLSLRRYLPKI